VERRVETQLPAKVFFDTDLGKEQQERKWEFHHKAEAFVTKNLWSANHQLVGTGEGER
jgi:hypothetical protein